MESNNGIIEKIKQFLKTEPDCNFSSKIADTTSLIESGVIDSFTVVKLVIFLEKTFNIKVEPLDLIEENINSIKNIESFVLRKLDKRA